MTHPNLIAKIGFVVRTARRRAKLTQEELAQRIERAPESVSNIERGVQMPSVETLLDLSRVLEIPIAELLGDVGFMPQPTKERWALETELGAVARSLSDRDLAVAVDQLRAFLDHNEA